MWWVPPDVVGVRRSTLRVHSTPADEIHREKATYRGPCMIPRCGTTLALQRSLKGEAKGQPSRAECCSQDYDPLHCTMTSCTETSPWRNSRCGTARKEQRMNPDVKSTGLRVAVRPRARMSPGREADDHIGMSRPSGRGGGGVADHHGCLSHTNAALTTPSLVLAGRARTLPVPAGRCRRLRHSVMPPLDSGVTGGLAALFFLSSLPPAATFLRCGLHGAAPASATFQPGEAYEGSSPHDDAFPLSSRWHLFAKPEGVTQHLVPARSVFALYPEDRPTREQIGGRALAQGRAPPRPEPSASCPDTAKDLPLTTTNKEAT